MRDKRRNAIFHKIKLHLSFLKYLKIKKVLKIIKAFLKIRYKSIYIKNRQSILLNYKRRRLYARTVSELNDLSVRELSDMGLSRSMIRNVVYSGVYKGQYDRDNQI